MEELLKVFTKGSNRHSYIFYNSKFLAIQMCFLSLIFLLTFSISHSFTFNCPTNNINCRCMRPNTQDLYKIACPSTRKKNYEIIVNVSPRTGRELRNETSVEIVCDLFKPDFIWRLVHGLDLSEENQEFSVTQFAIRNCPLPLRNDSLENLLHHFKINPLDILSFKFESHRSLLHFPDYMLSPLSNLTDLNLSHNQLLFIPNLSLVPKLKYLTIQNNVIRSIFPRDINFLQNLESLQMSSNRLRNIPQGSLPQSLIYLNLGNNSLSSLNEKTFSNLKKLESLILNVNPLDNVDPFVFNSLPSLKHLQLDTNILSSFPMVNSLPNLNYFAISSSPTMQTMCRKQTGKFEFEFELETTTTTTTATTEILSLSSEEENNSIKSECTLEDLPSLKDVYLVNNGLLDIPNFQNLPLLKRLILRSNQIHFVNPLAFQKVDSLQVLDLSRNQITFLQKSSFTNLPNLKELILHNNQIADIDPETFFPLKKLEKLDLRSNFLVFHTPLPPKIWRRNNILLNGFKPFKSLRKISMIDLSGNRNLTLKNK